MSEREDNSKEQNNITPEELLAYLKSYYSDKEFSISEIEESFFKSKAKKSLVPVFSQIINNGIFMSGSRENPNNPRSNTMLFKLSK